MNSSVSIGSNHCFVAVHVQTLISRLGLLFGGFGFVTLIQRPSIKLRIRFDENPLTINDKTLRSSSKKAPVVVL